MPRDSKIEHMKRVLAYQERKMERQEIEDAFDILAEALKLVKGKVYTTALEASLDVLQLYVVDQRRAADALERIAASQEIMAEAWRLSQTKGEVK